MVDGPVSTPVAATSDDSVRDALDRLSRKINAENYERMRWARDEAPKLVRLVELVKGAVADRTDVEINEEGGEGNTKRFVVKVHGQRVARPGLSVVKVHGQRVAGLGVALDKGRAIAAIGPIERSAYTVAQGEPIHARYEDVDEAWMGQTIAKLVERIGS